MPAAYQKEEFIWIHSSSEFSPDLFGFKAETSWQNSTTEELSLPQSGQEPETEEEPEVEHYTHLRIIFPAYLFLLAKAHNLMWDIWGSFCI